MERKDFEQRRQQLLYQLSCLPTKMVAAYEYDNLAEFVLYNLSHPQCFNLGKVAFFVDNADFNCIRGVAGVALQEGICATCNAWEQPEIFSQSMRNSSFNKTVRSIEHASCVSSSDCDQNLADMVLPLAFHEPDWHIFATKHGNKGILVYESAQHEEKALIQEHLAPSASLLAFCPIF